MTDWLTQPPVSHALFWPGVTLGVYLAVAVVHARIGRPAALHPVLVSIIVLSAGLLVLGVPYDTYAEPNALFTIWLAPSIAALAVPLYENLRAVRDRAAELAAGVLVGGAALLAIGPSVGLLMGLPESYLSPLATRTVTTPIALEIAETTGATLNLTVLGVFATGLPGAILIPALLTRLRVTDDETRGLILGLTSHAFGIARATEISPRATAFATLGMGLLGCFAALVVPAVLGGVQSIL